MKQILVYPPQVEHLAVSDLKPTKRNARTHSREQIKQIARSIEKFGFCNPVLISDDGTIIAGHGRVEAAKILGMTHVPILRLSHLGPVEIRAYAIADNKLAELAGWDREILALELQGLIELDFEVDLTGFSMGDIDLILQGKVNNKPSADDHVAEPQPDTLPICIPGDLWQLGEHRLLYGNALDISVYERLMQGEQAAIVFADPPYNVPISGHVSGLGRTQHREFAMASGEMSQAEFTNFLTTVFGCVAQHSKDGSIHFNCIDWRHASEALGAGKAVYDEVKNICVWNKSNPGMGSLYSSKHEFVMVFKYGTAPHTNNVELGKHGRSRSNVWDYPGVNTFGSGRDEALSTHPTVKPVALVADAIMDVSRRKDIVLDPFGGSGTTLIAAERTGRRARLIEIDPLYCDAIIRRWQKETGKRAIHADNGRSFDEITADTTATLHTARQRAAPATAQQVGVI